MKYKKVTELSKEEILGLLLSIDNWDEHNDKAYKNRKLIFDYHIHDIRGIWLNIDVIYTDVVDPQKWGGESIRRYTGILYNDYSIEIGEFYDILPIPVLELAEYINNNLKVKE